MSKKYLYKNILVFQSWGLWYSDYVDGDLRIALDRSSCETKKMAYQIAKDEVDYLNERRA